MRKSRLSYGLAFLMGSLVFLSAAVNVSASNTVILTLFPQENFVRNTAAPGPVTRSFSVPATTGNFTLRVINGSGTGENTISSAVVKVNGAAVVRTSDLNQNVFSLERTLTNLLKGSNTLEVEVRSVPSSYLQISIEGEYLLRLL